MGETWGSEREVREEGRTRRESEDKNLIFGGARRFVESLDKPQPRLANPRERKKSITSAI